MIITSLCRQVALNLNLNKTRSITSCLIIDELTRSSIIKQQFKSQSLKHKFRKPFNSIEANRVKP